MVAVTMLVAMRSRVSDSAGPPEVLQQLVGAVVGVALDGQRRHHGSRQRSLLSSPWLLGTCNWRNAPLKRWRPAQSGQ